MDGEASILLSCRVAIRGLVLYAVWVHLLSNRRANAASTARTENETTTPLAVSVRNTQVVTVEERVTTSVNQGDKVVSVRHLTISDLTTTDSHAHINDKTSKLTEIDEHILSKAGGKNFSRGLPRGNYSTTSATPLHLFETGLIKRNGFIWSRRILFCIILPLVAIPGIIGNCLSIYALSGFRKEGNTIVFLLGLTFVSVLENSGCLLQSVLMTVEELGDLKVKDFNEMSFAYLYAFLIPIIQRISGVFTMFMLIQRFVLVCFPFRVKQWCTPRNSFLPVVISVIFIFSYFVIGLFRYEIKMIFDSQRNATVPVRINTKFFNENKTFYDCWAVFGHVVIRGIPIITVAILSIVIIIRLYMLRELRSSMTINVTNAKHEHQITRVLVVIAAVYVLTDTLGLVYLPIRYFSSTFGAYKKDHYLYFLLVYLSSLLSCCNAAMNFLVYILACQRFKIKIYSICSRNKDAEVSVINVGSLSTLSTKEETISRL